MPTFRKIAADSPHPLATSPVATSGPHPLTPSPIATGEGEHPAPESPSPAAVGEGQRSRGEGLPALPQGWVWTTIGRTTTTTRHRIHPQNAKHLSYVGLEHIEAHTMRLLGTAPSDEMKSIAEHFWPGDVLYGRLRPYLNKVYRVDFEGLCSPEFIVFRSVDHLDARYVQYFLNSWDFVRFSTRLNEGDRPRVDFDQIAPYPFPLPPLPEQHRIVAAIEAHLSRIDAGIAALRRAQVALWRYRASVLKAACEGRLVPQDPSDEPAELLLGRILDERRTRWGAEQTAKGKDPRKVKYEAPVAPDTTELAELPQGWAYIHLEPLLSSLRKGMKTGPFGSILKKHEHREEGIPVLGIENIEPMQFMAGSKIHISSDKATELEDYNIEAGDILISRSGTVGEVCVVPEGLGEARFSTNLMRVVLDPNTMESDFFSILFNGSPFVLGQVTELCKGTTRAFLNQTILSSLIFPLPPLAEQRRIVAEVERRLSVVAEVEATVAANLKRAERLRQSVLKRAFEGKLVEQDGPHPLAPSPVATGEGEHPAPESPSPAAAGEGRRSRGEGRKPKVRQERLEGM